MLTKIPYVLTATALVFGLLTQSASAQSKPLVTEVRYVEAPAITCYQFSMRTTLTKMRETIGARVDQALADMTKAGVVATGPAQFFYRGATGEPDREFDLSVGWPVAAGAKPSGEYTVKALPPFKCAMLIYGGALADIGPVYEKLFAQLAADGKEPTGETREIYAYWVGPDSQLNVIVIQAGVK
jgi:effector-binding domain-containing protein